MQRSRVKPGSWCIRINPLPTTLFLSFLAVVSWNKTEKFPIVGKFCLVERYYYYYSIKLLLFKQSPKQVENDAACTFKYCFNSVLCRLFSGQPRKPSLSLALESGLCPQLIWSQTNFLALRVLKAMASACPLFPATGSSVLPVFSPATSTAAEQTQAPVAFTSPCHGLPAPSSQAPNWLPLERRSTARVPVLAATSE